MKRIKFLFLLDDNPVIHNGRRTMKREVLAEAKERQKVAFATWYDSNLPIEEKAHLFAKYEEAKAQSLRAFRDWMSPLQVAGDDPRVSAVVEAARVAYAEENRTASPLIIRQGIDGSLDLGHRFARVERRFSRMVRAGALNHIDAGYIIIT